MPGGRTKAPTTKPRSKIGRPSSLTEETTKLIVGRILNLGSYEDAAIAGGIDPRTMQSWLAKGRKDFAADKQSDYRQFYQRIEQANGNVKAILTGRVYAASRTDGRLALKILERRFAKDWGLKIALTDETPQPKKSPRETLIGRLASIEERQTEAAKALGELASRGYLSSDSSGDG